MSELNFYGRGNSQIMITKSNTLIEAGYDLTFAEHDLMTLAVNKLHKEKTGGKQVMISAKEFAAANNVSDNTKPNNYSIAHFRAVRDSMVSTCLAKLHQA